jgi:hypothetical protein
MALTAKPKKPAHHRKRQAGHHRRSKHYVKTYWPYLPMLVMLVTVSGGILINSFWSGSQVLGERSDFSASELLLKSNEMRMQHNQPTLQLDARLSAAAQAKADDMVSKNYWSHTGPNGSTSSTLLSQSGYTYQVAGENLAYGFRNADQVITGWMSSPDHRANLLSADYYDVGFGVASSPNFLGKGPHVIVVAEYAAPGASTANIRFNVDQTEPQVLAQQDVATKRVAAVQLFTDGRAAWSSIAVAALAGAAATLFVLKHGYRIHRALTRGEMFLFTTPGLMSQSFLWLPRVSYCHKPVGLSANLPDNQIISTN